MNDQFKASAKDVRSFKFGNRNPNALPTITCLLSRVKCPRLHSSLIPLALISHLLLSTTLELCENSTLCYFPLNIAKNSTQTSCYQTSKISVNLVSYQH